MTFPEYLYRMRAFNLAQVDKKHDMYLEAWLHRSVKAQEKKGNKTKHVFTNFKEFFDYEKELKEIDNPKQELSAGYKKLARIAARLNN